MNLDFFPTSPKINLSSYIIETHLTHDIANIATSKETRASAASLD